MYLQASHRVFFNIGAHYKRPITAPTIMMYYKTVLPAMEQELGIQSLDLLDGIEAVKSMGNKERFIMLHIKPTKEAPKKDFPSIITNYMNKAQTLDGTKSMQVYFDGENGYILTPHFDSEVDMNTTRDALVKLLGDDIHDSRVCINIPKPGARINIPYSVNKSTGLAMVPVQDVNTFTPDQAKITKYTSTGLKKMEGGDVPAIGVDFDGTLFIPTGVDPHKGSLNEAVADLVVYAKDKGYKVIILTSRTYGHPEEEKFIADFLTSFKVPFDEITYEKKPEIKIIIDDISVNPNDLKEK